jgi:hypothetical protein
MGECGHRSRDIRHCARSCRHSLVLNIFIFAIERLRMSRGGSSISTAL